MIDHAKSERDQAVNARLSPIHVVTSQIDWAPFSPGVEFKLLSISAETGAWTVLFKASAGAQFARHEHLAAGEYYLISGVQEVRGGDNAGGTTSIAGDYGYEPLGVVHDVTCYPEDSVLLFKCYGVLRLMDDNDQTVAILDAKAVREAWEAGSRAVHH